MTEERDEQLIAAARRARENAYAPYSGFRVGAAVLTEDDRIFDGANVENASLGLTICAERVAIAGAVAHGARNIRRIVVVSDAGTPATPCGACRQVLHEFGPGATVLAVAAESTRSWVLDELLPAPFDGARLQTRGNDPG